MKRAGDLRRYFGETGRDMGLAGMLPRPADRSAPDVSHAGGTRPAALLPVDAAAETVPLLDQAAKRVVALLERCQRLEDKARSLEAWARAQIEAAQAASARSRDLAAEAETRLEAAQKAYDAVQKRAEAAEKALARDSRVLDALQERIIGAFGFGLQTDDGPDVLAAA